MRPLFAIIIPLLLLISCNEKKTSDTPYNSPNKQGDKEQEQFEKECNRAIDLIEPKVFITPIGGDNNSTKLRMLIHLQKHSKLANYRNVKVNIKLSSNNGQTIVNDNITIYKDLKYEGIGITQKKDFYLLKKEWAMVSYKNIRVIDADCFSEDD